MNPIPADPANHITEQQVVGLMILKKFGWKLVCIRRAHGAPSTTILHNAQDGTIGILESNGILKISKTIQIRQRREETQTFAFNTTRLFKRMNQPVFGR